MSEFEEVAEQPDIPEVFCSRHYEMDAVFVPASPARVLRAGGTEYRADLCAECVALLTPLSEPEPAVEESVPEFEE